MQAEIVFSIFNTLVLPVWLLMIVAPRWKVTKWIIYSYAVPLAISLAYAIIIFSNFGAMGEADFSSLEGIKALFSKGTDWTITAAWFHYLAFDLLVGTWILKDSQEKSISHWFIIPCLFFTFMLGPVGFVLYYVLQFFFTKKN